MQEKTIHRGPAPAVATATLILVHGRGASAESILAVYEALKLPGLAALAPQAPTGMWYPKSFLAPIPENQPDLDRALNQLDEIVTDLLNQSISSSRIALLGFSQGACLVTEYAARHPRRYGAVMGLTGGLIGPPGTPRDYPGSLDSTPVFLGASDPDPHVPFARVEETSRVLSLMGAVVETRRYPDMPHTVCEDELDACRTLLEGIQ